MVQTSQNISFVPARRSAEADRWLIKIHEAEKVDQLSRALFSLAGLLMPYHFCNLLLRPLEFELPCRFSPARYKPLVDAYMKRHHKDDIWLQRSPVHPGVTAVRHGDYTPPHILRQSAFYRNVLQPLGAEFAASVVAWRGQTWLATLTVMRSAEQGEFTDVLMEELEALHPHFQCAIRRMAGRQESRLIHSSLGRVISALPTAAIVLDWDLRPLHFSSLAAKLCSQWRNKARSPHLKLPRRFQVPGDILSTIESMRPALTRRKWVGASPPRTPFRAVHPHPKIGWLSAAIEFLPSRSLTLGKGIFLVTLTEKCADDAGEALATKLVHLSPRERECATLAAEGLQNKEIAQRLGKSTITVRNQLTSVFKKLELDSRHKLITAFARLDAATKKNLHLKRPARRKQAAPESRC